MVVVVFVWVLSDALGSACAQRMLKVVDDPPGCVRCCAALWATDMGQCVRAAQLGIVGNPPNSKAAMKLWGQSCRSSRFIVWCMLHF